MTRDVFVPRKKVLVVDDQEIMHMALHHFFNENDVLMWQAFHADEALVMLVERAKRKTIPDMIITDYHMPPGKNGIEFIREVRTIPSFKDIPIFLWSAIMNESLEDRGYKSGASMCLSKHDLIEIKTEIQNWLFT